jgi:hypothetical protein
MSFWNIQFDLKDQGEKNIDIYDESDIDLKAIITRVITKFDGTVTFFNKATKKLSSIYQTEYISVTIMNDHLGYINFHAHKSINTIKVTKRELFLLKNIL